MSQKDPVFITGASGGIGHATAWYFARKGHPLSLGCHRNTQTGQELCKALCDAGHEAIVCQGDVSREDEVARMFQKAQETFGPVMILVNNAGHSEQRLFTDISLAAWEQMFAVHVRGSFLCSQHVLPSMLQKKRGCIINVSSMWGQVGASCEVHYSAAKAAVIGLTKSLAKELAPSHIRVNCVAPGAIETAMLSELDALGRELLCEETPLGRLGSPEEVAAAIGFLASEQASFFTGQVLSPNGGLVV